MAQHFINADDLAAGVPPCAVCGCLFELGQRADVAPFPCPDHGADLVPVHDGPCSDPVVLVLAVMTDPICNN